MMKYVAYEVKDRLAYITLDRAEKRNALNAEMVQELTQAFEMADQDDAAKVVILRANGKAFCAGADLAYIQDLQNFTFEENLHDSQQLRTLFYKIYTLSKVVIAQVQGHALAGGCGLAAVCDFSFSVPEAKFGYTEVRIGFIPALVKVFLVRKIGEMRAKFLLLTGELINAERAAQMELINEVVPAEDLAGRVYDFAQNLCRQNSGQSMALTKRMIAEVQNKSLEEGLDYAAEMNAEARGTTDCQKGIAAFLNKEPIEW